MSLNECHYSLTLQLDVVSFIKNKKYLVIYIYMIHLGHRLMKSSHSIGHKLGFAANMIGHKIGPAIIGGLNNAFTVAKTATKLKNLLTRGR